MIYLTGKVTSYTHPRLGVMMTPRRREDPPPDVPIAVDNGCFADPGSYHEGRYVDFVAAMPRERTLFAAAPDVLGDHAATVRRSLTGLRAIRRAGVPAAFVAQDGWDEHDTPWDELDVLFIGGTTEFKLRGGRAAAQAARRRGKRVHMGRVNGLGRLRAAVAIGCDSADGNCLTFGPDKNWPRVRRWLESIDQQAEMAECG